MKKTDVLVIGGSAAGIVAAVSGKSFNPDKHFLLIRKEKQAIVPCAIPYIFGSMEDSNKNIMSDGVLTNAGIEIMVGEVVLMDPENHTCKTADGTEIAFEKLVLATGSKPAVPKWLKGADLDHVFTVDKDKQYLDMIIEKLEDCEKIVTIGGGFIGVEVSDELKKRGKDVTIVEILPNILGLVFDSDIAVRIEDVVKSRGVKIETGSGVKEILGDKRVTSVLLNNGKKLEADAVILAMGYRPNVELAKESGIKINDMGFIEVDEYMRTGSPDILAIGDCAEKRDFNTRKLSGVMLASTACAEARIAGMNLYKLCALKTFSGTLAIFCTALEETGSCCASGFGAAGINEGMAKDEGFDVVTGTFRGVDKHPGTLPGTKEQFIKLVVARASGTILGGEVIGGPSVGELVNLVGFAIQNRMTVYSILASQIGTHPLLTAPPTAYPLIKSAESAVSKLKA